MPVHRRKGSQMYLAEFKCRGFRYREATGTKNRVEVQRYEREMRSRVEKPVKRQQGGVMTVTEACEKCLVEELLPRSPRRDTARNSAHNLELMGEYFGDIPLQELTTARVTYWRSSMIKSGLAAATVNPRLATLKAVLNKAKRLWRVIEEVPRNLRHHFAARLVRRGQPLSTVQKLLGHSTNTLTERYTSLAAEDREGAVAILD